MQWKGETKRKKKNKKWIAELLLFLNTLWQEQSDVGNMEILDDEQIS